MWVKITAEFSRDCRRARLSDTAFRLHVEGLSSTMADGTDGRVSWVDLRSFAVDGDLESALAELTNARFWRSDGPRHWQIVHHMDKQKTQSQMEAARRADSARQAKARAKRTASDVGAIPQQRVQHHHDGPTMYGMHVPPQPGSNCEVCGRATPVPKRVKRGHTEIFADHCHRHGWVRGYVCRRCNALMALVDAGREPYVAPELLEALHAHALRCATCHGLFTEHGRLHKEEKS